MNCRGFMGTLKSTRVSFPADISDMERVFKKKVWINTWLEWRNDKYISGIECGYKKEKMK